MSKFWSTGSSSSSSEDRGNESKDSLGDDDFEGSDVPLGGDEEISNDALSLDPILAWDTIKSKQEFPEPLTSTNAKPPNSTRIVCISDTHGKHGELHLPPGDVLIHGGDFTKSGEPGSIRDLDRFFGASKFKEIICIAGNHDMTLHPEFYENNWKRFHKKRFKYSSQEAPFQNCTYLEDATCTTRCGLEVYGSPWSPFFFDWAFNLDRGGPIRELWDNIPNSTDVLVTHGPPLGRGDHTRENGRAGCYDLLVAVQNRVRPRVHVFGHIHEGYGASFDGRTLFVNASNLNILYQAVNHPIVIDIPHDRTQVAKVVRPKCRLQSRDLWHYCQDHGFLAIAGSLKEFDASSLPSKNELLGQDAFDKIANSLDLHRDRVALKELRSLQARIYAESFPPLTT